MNRYYWVTRSLADKGQILPSEAVEHLQSIKQLVETAPKNDWYRSMFFFPKKVNDYFASNNGSISGYNSECYTDRLIWDFDSQADIEASKKDAIALVEKLEQNGVDVWKCVEVYFSGNKGFHVELQTSINFSPEEAKAVCSSIAGDLKTFDQQIYNTTRKYRIPNTPHNKTNLYKILVPLEDIRDLSVEQIKDRAKYDSWKLCEEVRSRIEPTSATEFLEKNKIKKKKPAAVSVSEEDSVDGIRGLGSINFSNCPRNIPRCIYALEHGVMVPGERNSLFYRLATFYRNQGKPKLVAYKALKGVAELNAVLYPDHDAVSKEELYNTVIHSVYDKQQTTDENNYSGHCGTSKDNELVEKYCSAIKGGRPCILHSKTQAEDSIVKISDVSENFSQFAENFDKNTVKTGIETIDRYMDITIGTTTLLVGATGSGKTTMCLQMMENANKMGQHTMFFSMDMHKTLVYLKLALKHTNYDKNEILNFYKTKNEAKKEMIRDIIAQKYDKTYFDFGKTMNMDDMLERIKVTEEKTGNKIKLVIVDYAGRIAGPYSDSYANARYNALKSVEVAEKSDAAWIILNQVSRNSGDGSSPLRTKRVAKESGDWEESATNIITMWRPFMGKEGSDDVVRVFLAKNRMGSEIERPLWWDGSRGTVSDMTEEEFIEYKEMRQAEEESSAKSFKKLLS